MPWAVVICWLALLAFALPFAGQLGEVRADDSVDYLPASADSTQVAELRRGLPGGDTADLIIVYEREEGLTSADRETAAGHLAGIAADYELAGDPPDGILAEDGGTAMYPLALAAFASDEEAAEAVADIRDRVADTSDGLEARVGGSGALSADSKEVFASVDVTLTLATVAIVTLLLILTYRSPVLWALPLLSAGVAAMAAMAVVYGLTQLFDLTVTTMSSSIMTVLIFGAGTDYALLLVSRYREELHRHPLPYDAMLAALRGCGPAILAASGTVSAGLLCLLAADLNSSSGLGPFGAAGILCALAVMLTLLPALLVLAGRRVFWPLIPRHGSEGTQRYGVFARMGGSVARRPVAILSTGVVLLGALALGALNLPGQLKSEDSFTSTPESVAVMGSLAEAYPERSSQPVTVLAHTDRLPEVLAAIETVEGVASADAGRGGDTWTEIAVYATATPESDEERQTVEALRDTLGDVEGAPALVGGETAQQIDEAATSARDSRMVIPLVLVVVSLILVALLRSLVAPAVLLAAVVVSWGSALGLGGLLFPSVFGFEGTDSGLVLLTFVFSVALGVDYGIFLMHRMREEVLGGADTRRSALTALRTTGGVIASAGAVLAATFGVLMTLPLVMMVQMGFVVAVGVLLDTFLVRTYVVTSASWLLGERIWWPGRLSRSTARTGAGRDAP